MTLETKLIIGPEDVLAVRFECAKCRASVSIPIGNGLASHVSEIGGTSCSVCRTPWQIAHNSAEHTVLFKFASALANLAESLKGRSLLVKMEVKGQS